MTGAVYRRVVWPDDVGGTDTGPNPYELQQNVRMIGIAIAWVL